MTKGGAIRVLAFEHTPHVGGAEVALLTAAEALHGVSVDLAIAGPGRGALERGCRARGLPFHAVPVDRVSTTRPWSARRALEAARALVRGCAPDVVLVNGLRGLKVCLALESAGPPVVAFVHDVLGPGTASRSMRAFGLFRSRVSLYLVPAQAARVALVGAGIDGGRVRVVPPSVDVAGPLDHEERACLRRSVGLDPISFVVGFVGQLEARKGVDVLLDALGIEPRDARSGNVDRPNRESLASRVSCLVVGDDPFGEHRRYRDAVLRRARASHHVRVTGWRADAARLVAALDVLVCPSRSDACPLVVLQAMAAGVAVVGSRIGGIAEQLGDEEAGLLVDPGDASALARALSVLSENPQRRAALGSAGRERYERLYSAARARAELLAALRDVV